MECQFCGSSRVTTRQWGKRLGCTVGGVAGALSGASAALSCGEIGACAGVLAGPAGMAIGGVAGVLLGGLAGAAVGCMAGEESGSVFDGRVFHDHQCEECGHSFTL